MIDLKNKKVLITGSTDGLGLLLAKELAKLGCNVIVQGRDQNKIDNVVEELRKLNPKGKFESVLCDFNKPETIKNAFFKVYELDILINNVGIWHEGKTVETNIDRAIELVNVNLMSCITVTRLLLDKLEKSKQSQILNISSVAGYEVPKDYFHTVYSATKYGIAGFSEALAKEFEGKTLRVMGFYPGGMQTSFFQKAGMNYKAKEAWMFDPMESVEAIIFMLTRNPKVSVKRMDLINQLFE